MPPELLKGQSFSKAVDVYMFGVVLWEIFSREIPFHGYSFSEIKKKVVNDERPVIPTLDVPKAIQNLISKCWHQKDYERPAFSDIVEILVNESSNCSEVEVASAAFGDALDNLI